MHYHCKVQKYKIIFVLCKFLSSNTLFNSNFQFNMTKVKICGITSLEDALAASKFGADALGFNFYKKSPRYISPEAAFEIIQYLPVTVQPIGVFVDKTPEDINEIALKSGIQVVQLHGEEMELDEINKIQYPILKAYRISQDFNSEIIKSFNLLFGATTFVIDAYNEKLFGGTGKQIQKEQALRLVKEISEYGYVFLAGGLNEKNVAQAINKVKPYGVDVASGVESAPGRKDHCKMAQFILQAKYAISPLAKSD